MPLPDGFKRLFRLPSREVDRDIEDEFEFHLAMKARDLEDEGLSPAEARAEAVRRFGDIAGTRGECRTVQRAVAGQSRRRDLLDAFRQDLRIGFRMLRRSPGFTGVAVLTLVVGVGANTAIFSVLNSVLLRPLPYPEPGRLVQIVEWNPQRAEQQGRPSPDTPVSAHNYRDYRETNTVFEEMGWVAPLYDVGTVNMAGGDRPERVRGLMVSASLFSVLGVEPMLGSAWRPEEDEFAFEGPRVAILSSGLWRRGFAADPGVLGRSVTIDGWPHTIVGVMPPRFRVPPLLSGGRVGNPLLQTGDLYVPLGYNAYGLQRRARQFTVLARLRAGVDPEQGQAEIGTLAAGLAATYPGENAGWTARVIPLTHLLAGSSGPQLTMLMAVVGFVLLIACANVANLLLARGAGRTGEMAVRAALGGGRVRLVRQLLTESLLLAVAGAAGGLLLAYASNRFLVTLIPAELPRADETAIDGTVLLFALGLTVGTALLFGLLPAFRASQADLAGAMKAAPGRSTGRRGGAVSRGLVAAEVALALMLLVGAGLLTRSFLRLAGEDPGYERENVLKVPLNLGTPNVYNTRYYNCALRQDRPLLWQLCRPNDEAMRRFYHQMVERVERVPGVESAALISSAPLTNAGIYPLRVPAGPGEAPPKEPGRSGGRADERAPGVVAGRTDGRLVYPGYFRTMGIRLLSGRDFREEDPRGWSGVAVINETLARRLWPGENPVGKRLSFYGGSWMTVIGVVEDTQDTNLSDRVQDDGSLASHVYYLGQFPYMDLMVRTRGESGSLVEPIQNAILELDPNLPLGAVTTLEEMARESNAMPRFYALMVGIFAAIALLIAAVGLYGVVAFTVGRRTQEIGLRKALGATSERITMMVVTHAMRSVLLGVVIGAGGALAVTRLLRSFLYGMDPADPVMFLSVTVVMAAVAFGASYLPARRASRLDPVDALRYE